MGFAFSVLCFAFAGCLPRQVLAQLMQMDMSKLTLSEISTQLIDAAIGIIQDKQVRFKILFHLQGVSNRYNTWSDSALRNAFQSQISALR